MADTSTDNSPEATPVAPKRDDTTDQTVTELATVDGTEKDADLKAMAGIDGKVTEASDQQQNVYAGLKDAHADINGKDPKVEAMPFSNGPGSDVA